MDSTRIIVAFLFYSTLAGLLGALAMVVVMRLMARAGARGEMVVALGSLFTRTRDHARLVGGLLHMISAVAFGQLYTVLMVGLQLTGWPTGLLAGLGFGLFHGIVVSLALVWVVADQHPLAEFRTASASVFLTHLAGHVAYGAVVGLVIALAPV
ncbi:hypothetical protein OPIT5_00865 [Opitutaceae bacterium TAV5]|nr:hypothetical protein OPIT5_00865 [Opitutaceae bacterium TAV5]